MAGLYTDYSCSSHHQLRAGTILALTTPVKDNGVTLFRHTVYLKCTLDKGCSAFHLSPSSHLQFRFIPTALRITSSDKKWINHWVDTEDTVSIELTHPAPILALSSQRYNKIAVHRVDGEAISEQATVTINSGQQLAEPLLATNFIAKLSKRLKHGQKKPDKTTVDHSSEQQITADKGQGGHGKDIREYAQSALSSLSLQAQPTNPRIRLLNADRSETLWQWMEAGQQTNAVAFSSSGTELVKRLAPALNRAFKQKTAEQDIYILPLQIESDTPCQVIIDQADLDYLLESELLNEPTTYTFTGQRANRLQQNLSVPDGLIQGCYLDGTIDIQPRPWQSTPPPLANENRLGIELSKGDQLAVPITIEQPLKLSGLSLAWYNMAEQSELKARISQDNGGQPATKSLAEMTQRKTGNTAKWLNFRMPETALQPGIYWVKLSLNEGTGIWLGRPASPAQQIWQATGGLPVNKVPLPLQLLTWPLASDPAEPEAATPLQVSLNGINFPLAETVANRITAELTNIPSTLHSAPIWNFEIASSQSLTLTVNSLRIRYSLTVNS